MRNIWIIVSVLLLVACQRQGNVDKGKKESDKEKVIINVEAAESFLGESIATLRSTAILEADKAATITTKTSGIILDLMVEEGDFVKQDDVMLVLESTEQKLSVTSAKANYDKSLNNYQRAQQLIKKGLTNKEQLDNLKFETESLKSALDQAKMNLSYTQVKAPFDGVVVKRMVKIGNLIQNATPVYEIVDFDSLQAKIDVPEHQWNIMQAGLPVLFEFDALDNQKVPGEIIRVSPIIDANSGTFQVTVAVENSERLLRPGLFAKANIIFDKKENAVLVDKNAIIREDELSFVYLIEEGNKVKKTQVELGYEMPDTYEIKSGLLSKQKVVTTGKNNLTPDTEINVVNYNEAS